MCRTNQSAGVMLSCSRSNSRLPCSALCWPIREPRRALQGLTGNSDLAPSCNHSGRFLWSCGLEVQGVACTSLSVQENERHGCQDHAIKANRLLKGLVSWLQREVTLVKRNAFLYIFRFFLLTLIAIVVVSTCVPYANSLCFSQSGPSSWIRQSAGSVLAVSWQASPVDAPAVVVPQLCAPALKDKQLLWRHSAHVPFKTSCCCATAALKDKGGQQKHLDR